MSHTLKIVEARTHNLTGFDLELPHHRWTSVTGVSGSGKTSLVMDLVVREGQRRFLGGWSPRARRLLDKLGDADAADVTGLPAPLALGSGRLSRSERSTVGTLSGVLDLLRLLYAREGSEPGLSRSDFSFNAAGACPTCAGSGLQDSVAPDLLVADPTRSIRDGALHPTLKNGYTVYSQVTVDVMDTICKAHGFTVDTPWQELSDEQQHIIFHGTQALVVPFGKHSLESRLKWEGITAKPREEGYYRGLIPVIRETLKRSRNPNILKYARSVPCEACEGTRLGEPARRSRLGQHSLPDLCATPLRALGEQLRTLPAGPVLQTLQPQLQRRVAQAVQLGLGHLSLARRSTTLSDGELQRLRLVSQLGLQLGGLLLALDEPTLGLHPSAHPGLNEALRDLVDLGNTAVLVEHDPSFVRHADEVLTLGPGAGSEGGRIIAHGATPPLPLGPLTPEPRPARAQSGHITLRGARLHGLHTDLNLRKSVLNVVCGPSGAGKSSLVFGTLLPALRGEPAPLQAFEGADGLDVHALDSRPLGRNSRSTPATATGLFDLVRKHFAALPEAKAAGLRAGHFSHNNKAGRCEVCEGLGVQRVGLHLMADVERRCVACGGGRYAPSVLTVSWRGHTIADVLQCTAEAALRLFDGEDSITSRLTALVELGLGYLPLGRSTTTLSRGEAQRIKLATLLGAGRSKRAVVLLDEPDRGLHPTDLARLIRGLDALVEQGHTVVAISHHRHLWSAADHLIEVRDGVARSLDAVPEAPPAAPRRAPAAAPEFIELTGVQTHNLRDLTVRIPHGKITAVTGVSGSGKSSLVFDTLAAEAQRRFAETLPFEVRRALRRLPQPRLTGATGLSPTLSLQQVRTHRVHTSTVGTQSGLDAPLRLLWARAGTLDGAPHDLLAERFSPRHPEGACPTCSGRGTQRRCDPAALVTHPERSLRDGALGGTAPGRFFTDPHDRYLALLGALIGSDRLDAPWTQLSAEEQATTMHGHPDVVEVVWHYQRGKRRGEHALSEPWRGLVALVEEEAPRRADRKNGADWWVPFHDVACPDCGGDALAWPARSVRVGDRTIAQLRRESLTGAHRWLQQLPQDDAVVARIVPSLLERLAGLLELGLGHLSLSTASPLLSSGEHQRVRLAGVLNSGLTGLTVVLDEPAAGLDARGTQQLHTRLRSLCDEGNTVVMVTHREALLRRADHLIELGPGAGPDGGLILDQGPPASVLDGDSPTAQGLRLSAPATTPTPPLCRHLIAVRLRDGSTYTVDLPEHGLVTLEGPSGSGTSTLLRDVLGASAREGQPRGCERIEGLDDLAVEGPASASAHSTVVSALGALTLLKRLFHDANPDIPAKAFSFNSPAGRCPICKGSGEERVALDILADLRLPCPECDGHRYAPHVLGAQLHGLTIASVLEQAPRALPAPFFEGDLGEVLARLEALSLDHLPLGTPTRQLSGGELQRLALASLPPSQAPTLLLLDRPDEGLHELDVRRLLTALEPRLQRDLVVIATHHPTLCAAAAHRVTLPAPRLDPT